MRKTLVLCLLLMCLGCSKEPQPKAELFIPPIGIPKVEKAYTGTIKPILRIASSSPYQKCQPQDAIVTSYGTAFVTKLDGRVVIVTAYHVVDDGQWFHFYTEDRKRVEVKFSRVHMIPSLDTAVFIVDKISAKVTPYEPDVFGILQNCQTIGFPENGNKAIYTGKSIKMGVTTTSRVDSGMSGGPTLSSGKVVGIISSKILNNDKKGAQSVIIKLSDVFDYLRKQQH